MSPGRQLREERLRALCQSLVSDEANLRFGKLFHAAIRSDDPVLQSIMDEDCADDALIPAFVGEWVHDPKAVRERSVSFSELLALSNSEPSGIAHKNCTNTDARAFRHRLWEILWQAAICGPDSQIKGFRIEWSEWADDVTIDAQRWSSCIVSNGEERLDDDALYQRLDELGTLVRDELLTLRTVEQPNGYNCAIAWIELAYELFPQKPKDVLGIQTIILPWSLAKASALVIGVLIDNPEWRPGTPKRSMPLPAGSDIAPAAANGSASVAAKTQELAPKLPEQGFVEPMPAGAVTSPCRVVLRGQKQKPVVSGNEKEMLPKKRYEVVEALVNAWPNSMSKGQLEKISTDYWRMLNELSESDPDWKAVIEFAREAWGGYRIG